MTNLLEAEEFGCNLCHMIQINPDLAQLNIVMLTGPRRGGMTQGGCEVVWSVSVAGLWIGGGGGCLIITFSPSNISLYIYNSCQRPTHINLLIIIIIILDDSDHHILSRGFARDLHLLLPSMKLNNLLPTVIFFSLIGLKQISLPKCTIYSVGAPNAIPDNVKSVGNWRKNLHRKKVRKNKEDKNRSR